ncbi:MAG: hypothetical protein OEL57_11695 [Trichlorobacter sp.]|uniref:hypothetical protein n=1 Tax=Trichlorobacter sp. TaxID=2911007 RepID=UPI00256172F0|nr:hypothetical protein [Trichlorobacter sp.]MDK9718550.1 hypothetical protein [Trichlorobacter sp.]
MEDAMNRHHAAVLKILITILATMLLVFPPANSFSEEPTPASRAPQQKLQSIVMGMADEYIAALGESMYLLTRSGTIDSKGRWLSLSFLRNGVGASLDIAVGPNPQVSLLDLLVLTSLQSWAFEKHWIPNGIGNAGKPALARLKQAEAHAWAAAGKQLTEAQLQTLKRLISAWIAENSDRTVVSLVRFSDFGDSRKISSLSLRGQAHGLLSEVSEASAAVDDVRLLGERVLWFAGRYPYLLGEQSELTAYRVFDQPEFKRLIEASKSAQELSDTLSRRIATMETDLKRQQDYLFGKLAAERREAVKQVKTELDASISSTIQQADQKIQAERTRAINHFFQMFGQERKKLLDDLTTREKQAGALMGDLRKTLELSDTTVKDVAATTKEIDKLLSRYQEIQRNVAHPLKLDDVRGAAVEAGKTAEKTTQLLEKLTILLESKSFERAVTTLHDPIDRAVDRLFWRGVVLICLLIGGLGLLRLLPSKR